MGYIPCSNIGFEPLAFGEGKFQRMTKPTIMYVKLDMAFTGSLTKPSEIFSQKFVGLSIGSTAHDEAPTTM